MLKPVVEPVLTRLERTEKLLVEMKSVSIGNDRPPLMAIPALTAVLARALQHGFELQPLLQSVWKSTSGKSPRAAAPVRRRSCPRRTEPAPGPALLLQPRLDLRFLDFDGKWTQRFEPTTPSALGV